MSLSSKKTFCLSKNFQQSAVGERTAKKTKEVGGLRRRAGSEILFLKEGGNGVYDSGKWVIPIASCKCCKCARTFWDAMH